MMKTLIGEKMELVTLALNYCNKGSESVASLIDYALTDSGWNQWNNFWLNIYWCQLHSLLVVYGEHLQIFDKASARPIKLVELYLNVKS